ncbi:hypothetical protein HMPREF9073_02435 [Capnocytophaga sp. oral taxon 326 str. F0382]|nr:hypothetical protein HMPREF9073_02435 [Capnocytophaga sp. oral taxon 326 str. F0382]
MYSFLCEKVLLFFFCRQKYTPNRSNCDQLIRKIANLLISQLLVPLPN